MFFKSLLLHTEKKKCTELWYSAFLSLLALQQVHFDPSSKANRNVPLSLFIFLIHETFGGEIKLTVKTSGK